ncbi:MAG TPA: PhoU domain-containing protein [Methanomassiliicoccales archaeon]|nr:PhoU domain-containing protein [Methanomassiliicoccales archaeon]
MDQLDEMLLELKDTSELMIDLAYSSLLYNNKEIAEEVVLMEEMLDGLANDIQRQAIERVVQDGDEGKAFTIIKLAAAVEEISDAAMQIAMVTIMDDEPHPVILLSIKDADTIITFAEVKDGSDLVGRTLGKMRLASQSGMWVVAIKRGRKYLYGPDKSTKLEIGDVVISRGPPDAEKYFQDLCFGKERLEDL